MPERSLQFVTSITDSFTPNDQRWVHIVTRVCVRTSCTLFRSSRNSTLTTVLRRAPGQRLPQDAKRKTAASALSLSHDAARTTFDFSPQSPVRNLLHVSVEVGSVKTSIMVDFTWRVLSNRFEVVLWHFSPAFVVSQCDGPLSLS